MHKVGVIGHFGFGLNLSNGQTIKTKIVTDALKNDIQDVVTVDAHGGIKAIVPVILGALKSLILCQNVIIMLTENGLKVSVPPLFLFNKIFKRKLHYVVVGGWLPEFLQKHKILRYCLKKFDFIYVETKHMKDKLESQGFSNAVLMPNCKHLQIVDEKPAECDVPYKLCTFSRVMKEKGIQDAVDAVVAVNKSVGKTVYTLDIYGQVDANQVEWFDKLERVFPEFIKYCGVIPYDKSTAVLKDYFFLLFPTYYYGEGFAGTAIDAFSAGVPVVASNWKYNEEVVHDGENGIIFEAKNIDSLVAKLDYLYRHPEVRNHMRKNCLENAKQFQPQVVLQTLYKNLA